MHLLTRPGAVGAFDSGAEVVLSVGVGTVGDPAVGEGATGLDDGVAVGVWPRTTSCRKTNSTTTSAI